VYRHDWAALFHAAAAHLPVVNHNSESTIGCIRMHRLAFPLTTIERRRKSKAAGPKPRRRILLMLCAAD
jgi:hypothetical protein